MSYAPLKVLESGKVLGSFHEKEFGKYFQYSENDEMILSPPAHGGKNVLFPHLIWVGNQERRYALVLNSVAHVITDETAFGWVVDKWQIHRHRKWIKS